MAHLSPYLNFDNNCREAMTFYSEALGGKIELQTVSSMPEMAKQMPKEMGDLILHSTVTFGNNVIMASDMIREKRIEGNTVHLCINCESDKEITTFFGNLSKDGKIIEPLTDMPWGGRYGALTDKFGKHWVFNWQKNGH